MSKLRYDRAQAEGIGGTATDRLVTLTQETEPRGGKKSKRTTRRVYR